MAETILIDATQREEVRVATVEIDSKNSNQSCNLYDLIVEPTRQNQRTGNIYKGVVRRCEQSLGAYFVDFRGTRDGFLAFKELAPEYVKYDAHSGRPNFEESLKVGQEIIVRVVKDERPGKGAALTTFISLAGFYVVLMPNKPRAGGISRHIEGDERDELKEAASMLNVPKGMGVIIRTAGVGRTPKELQWDLDILLGQWQEIKQVSTTRPAPFLIRQESDVFMRAVRDYMRPTVEQIIINDETTYTEIKEYLAKVRPDFVEKTKLYTSTTPLFTHYGIETQIESAFKRAVELENGASIVLDQTEALLAIDVNSARATEGSDIEDTAYRINLAAVPEIARQLRLRDAGGLVVVDFIDMKSVKHQRQIEEAMQDALKSDRARVQVGRLSRFGLLELSRQRLRSSLGDANLSICPRCDGNGRLRSVSSLALSILRVIEEVAMRANIMGVKVQVPVEIATYLNNEKRGHISRIEEQHQAQIFIIANLDMVTPQYKIEHLRAEDMAVENQPSYQQVESFKPEPNQGIHKAKLVQEEPAIKAFGTNSVPQAPNPAGESLVRRLWNKLFSSDSKAESNKENSGRNDNRFNRRGNNANREESDRGDGRRRTRAPMNRRRGGQNPNRREERADFTPNTREPRDNRERESREPRDNREPREHAPRETREHNQQPREPKEPRAQQAREPRDPREPREPRERGHQHPRHGHQHAHHRDEREHAPKEMVQAASFEAAHTEQPVADQNTQPNTNRRQPRGNNQPRREPREGNRQQQPRAPKNTAPTAHEQHNHAPEIQFEQNVLPPFSVEKPPVVEISAPVVHKVETPRVVVAPPPVVAAPVTAAPKSAAIITPPALPFSADDSVMVRSKAQSIIAPPKQREATPADRLPPSARVREQLPEEPLMQVKTKE